MSGKEAVELAKAIEKICKNKELSVLHQQFLYFIYKGSFYKI